METGRTADFPRLLARGMIISAAIVVPAGLLLTGLVWGGSALAGAAVGFALAAVYSVVVVRVMVWALKKPPEILPAVLMATYFVRLTALALAIYGLHFIKALDFIALLLAFLALYVTHSAIEVVYAFKIYGAVLKP